VDKTPSFPRFSARLWLFLAILAGVLACRLPNVSEMTTSSGQVLYQNDFSDRATGWQHISTENGIMGYDAGHYRFLILTPKFNYWSVAGVDFENVRIEVKSFKFAGPDENRMGVICRYQNESNYYFFIVSSDGYYAMGKVLDGQNMLIGQEQMEMSPAIQKGSAVNTLRVDCSGSTLNFYANDTLLGTRTDDSFQHGDVGLLAGAFTQPGVDVLFDNFIVFKP
jgi:hypothetical protein